MHPVASPAKAVSFEPAQNAATAIIDDQNVDAIAGPQATVELAQSNAQKSFESAPLLRSLLPKACHLASGQHISKADVQSAAQAQRHSCPSPAKAAADQSSAHAGSDQLAQHSRALSAYESPEGVSHPTSGEISTGVPGSVGIIYAGIAANLHSKSPLLVCSSPDYADQSSGIALQRAAAGSLTKQPEAMTHLADIPLVLSSSNGACQREEACGPGKQPQAPNPSFADMADHSSRQAPQSCQEGPQATAGDSSKQDTQSRTSRPSSVAGITKDPQGSTGAPEEGSEAAYSPSAVRPSSERRSVSSSAAEDAPECSPADDEPVLMENQVIMPPGKRLSQSCGKGGTSLDAKASGLSNSQDPASIEKTKVGRPAEQAASFVDLDDKARIASGVEAANKENNGSSASQAASDSQAGAQALMEEEQAKAAAAAAAQVVLACRFACCPCCLKESSHDISMCNCHQSWPSPGLYTANDAKPQALKQLRLLDCSTLWSQCWHLMHDILEIPLVLRRHSCYGDLVSCMF